MKVDPDFKDRFNSPRQSTYEVKVSFHHWLLKYPPRCTPIETVGAQVPTSVDISTTNDGMVL